MDRHIFQDKCWCSQSHTNSNMCTVPAWNALFTLLEEKMISVGLAGNFCMYIYINNRTILEYLHECGSGHIFSNLQLQHCQFTLNVHVTLRCFFVGVTHTHTCVYVHCHIPLRSRLKVGTLLMYKRKYTRHTHIRKCRA